MEVRYNRGRLIFMAVALAFFAAVTVYGAREQAQTDPEADFGALAIGVSVLLLFLSGRMGLLALNRDSRVLTIGPEGVTFHRSALGTVEWNRIEDVVHRKNALQKSLGFRFREPLPALPVWTRILYPFSRLFDSQAPHWHLPIQLVENPADEILENLARYKKSRGR